MSEHSVNLIRKPLPAFTSRGKEYEIPRYLFVGPKGGAEPIRVAFFAGVHGDEREGTPALTEFVGTLEHCPELARNYFLFVYPIANPTGFEAKTRNTADGASIPKELWRNSTSMEVVQLQSELWMHAFDGIVSLKTNPGASNVCIEVGGPIFARYLFGNGLSKAQDLLPLSINATAEALPKFRGALLEDSRDVIRAAPGVRPRPFEIVISIPAQAGGLVQRTAVTLLLQRALSEYRNFIAYGANI